MEKEILEILRDDIKEIRCDVKALLSFRAQAIGIVIGISSIISFVVSIIF